MRTNLNLRRSIAALAGTAAFIGGGAAPAAAAEQRLCVAVKGVTTCAQQDRPAADGCRNADLMPARGNLAAIRGATLCLVNRERTRRGLPRLQGSRPLRVAAIRYARLMVAHRFFGHASPTGSTFVERIRRTSYLRSASSWSVGENLAWGGGRLATPRAIVDAWMDSPGHRANILKASFREAGIGVAVGTPDGSSGGATYANEFGRRS